MGKEKRFGVFAVKDVFEAEVLEVKGFGEVKCFGEIKSFEGVGGFGKVKCFLGAKGQASSFDIIVAVVLFVMVFFAPESEARIGFAIFFSIIGLMVLHTIFIIPLLRNKQK